MRLGKHDKSFAFAAFPQKSYMLIARHSFTSIYLAGEGGLDLLTSRQNTHLFA